MADYLTSKKERKENGRKCQPRMPIWMITYADLVTLLLTFFILLMSMANMDPVKFSKASGSIRDALGIHGGYAKTEFTIPVLTSPPIARFSPVHPQTTQKIYEHIKSRISSLRLSDNIGLLKKNGDSIILRVNDSILFKAGQDKITFSAEHTLRTIAELIGPLPMSLRIEGHTDDTGESKEGFSNWDLSVARSISVLRFFSKRDLLSLDRMASVGYGSTRPIVSNKDEASRAANRRVDFVLQLNRPESGSDFAPQSSTVPL
ncbi:MAG: flagellar motor protein MotB [Deltaproteobacteria bacterium]|nr:flagellar motor protein MotB [Deltaproteobacteria bacterium]